MITNDRNLQVFMNSDTIEAFYLFRRIAAVEFVDDITDADV